MSSYFTQLRATLRIDRCGSIAVLVACLGLSGCSSTCLRGEGFRKDPTAAEVDAGRTTDQDMKFWGFSNKARDIERHMGATE